MKLKLALAAAVVITLSGCATQKQADTLSAQMAQLKADNQALQSQLQASMAAQQKQFKQLRPTGVCYLNGQPYTEGAVVAGRICDSNGIIIQGGERHLEWRNYTRIR
ncbi:hypothetical protein FXO89_23180 [Salmonella enterica]|nr:hypothetical protein [Salmonella enterica]